MTFVRNGHVFTVHREPVEVTSLHRPDPSWSQTCKCGVLHHWEPQGAYNPEAKYTLPTMESYSLGVYWNEDIGEAVESFALRCATCKTPTIPGYTADTVRTFIPGLAVCTVDGREVSRQEFLSLWEEANHEQT